MSITTAAQRIFEPHAAGSQVSATLEVAAPRQMRPHFDDLAEVQIAAEATTSEEAEQPSGAT